MFFLRQLKIYSILLIFLYFCQIFCISRPLSRHEINSYKEKIVSMFYHSYDNYLKFATNYDELKPISCEGTDTWGQFSLSLIDALDTLVVFGNYTEFRRIAQLVLDTIDFNTNINVSVFETNIRVIGGLLSAHLLSHKAGMETEPGWPCSGPLLRLAEDVARRLLPAFETKTGMPFGTVNLRYGVPENETPITCTSGVGTFALEFCTLSRLTGDPVFENKALKALDSLYQSRSKIGLVGNHINVEDGKWTATDSGIGGGVDSYFEYLVKGAMLLQMPQLMDVFYEYYKAINKYLKKEDWYVWVSMTTGVPTMPIFQSLEAFWPGIQTLIGDVEPAKKTIYNYHQVWKQYGFTPEFYDIPNSKFNPKRDGYPLRPEFIESVLYLYRATKDPHLLQIGADVIDSIETSAKTECGFATVKSVGDHTIEDRMESFFLAETLKYLYLLFDETNFVHNDGSKGIVIERNGAECVVDSGGYVFNTEAHLIDIAAVYCCSKQKEIETKTLSDFQNNLDLHSILGLNQKPMKSLNRIKDKYLKEVKIDSYFSETDYNIVTNDENVNENDFSQNENISSFDSKVIIEMINKLRADDSKSDTVPDIHEISVQSDIGTKTSDKTMTSSNGLPNIDSLSPTLASSISDPNIPIVEKTVSQDFQIKSDSKVESLAESDLSFGKDLKETIDLKGSSVLVPKVIEPTHAIEGWHSKSMDKDMSEERILDIEDIESLNTSSVDYELLLCPSQPFLSRLSYFGQMIIYS